MIRKLILKIRFLVLFIYALIAASTIAKNRRKGARK